MEAKQMKLLFENWRKYLNEITSTPVELKDALKQTIFDSKFWEQPHGVASSDAKSDGLDGKEGTPATETLQEFLNKTAMQLQVDLYFHVSVADEEYVLGPEDPYGGYPNNWMTQGMYRGPYAELNDKHVVWLEFRPISEDYDLEEFNSGELVEKISTTLNHELVHYYQLKKQVDSKGLSDYDAYREMVCDPEQVPVDDPDQYRELCGKEPPDQPGDKRVLYLTRHGEIDAYAYEAAEQLLSKYNVDDALNAIRRITPVGLDRFPELSSVVQDYGEILKDNPEELNKFRKKLYQQIQQQSGERRK
jgi:hypothetical protein